MTKSPLSCYNFMTRKYANDFIWVFVSTEIQKSSQLKGKRPVLCLFINEENVKNYQPDSFLPIFVKVLESLKNNEMYSYFIGSDVPSPDQSGFKQRDS